MSHSSLHFLLQLRKPLPGRDRVPSTAALRAWHWAWQSGCSVSVCCTRAEQWFLPVRCHHMWSRHWLQSRVHPVSNASSSSASSMYFPINKTKEALTPKAHWSCRTNPKRNLPDLSQRFFRIAHWALNWPQTSAETVNVCPGDSHAMSVWATVTARLWGLGLNTWFATPRLTKFRSIQVLLPNYLL